jgi:hypothetical protein
MILGVKLCVLSGVNLRLGRSNYLKTKFLRGDCSLWKIFLKFWAKNHNCGSFESLRPQVFWLRDFKGQKWKVIFLTNYTFDYLTYFRKILGSQGALIRSSKFFSADFVRKYDSLNKSYQKKRAWPDWVIKFNNLIN